jgi:enoyl-CoA hydratase/carnithine racemase
MAGTCGGSAAFADRDAGNLSSDCLRESRNSFSHAAYFWYTVRTTLQESPTETPGIAFRYDADVLTVTLDRPPGNEISAEMFSALAAVLAREATAPSVKVLVLRAEGTAFCTGRDRAVGDLALSRREAAQLIALKKAFRESPLITVSRVHGAARGFGMGLAILSDFAIVADDAPLAFPEMRAGLPPAAIMAYLSDFALPRHAFPLVLFAEPFTPAYAQAIGLINHAVPASELDATVDALVTKIRAIDAGSARACKELFQTMLGGTFDANCRLAVDALAVASVTLMRRPADMHSGDTK